MTFLREESDKVDESESGLQPEGGDNRCKGIMILLRSHRPSVESGLKSAREPSHPMSAAGQKATGRGAFNPSHDLVTSNTRALRFPRENQCQKAEEISTRRGAGANTAE